MKIALYITSYASEIASEVYFDLEGHERNRQWVRISEIVDVEFPPLPVGEVVEKQLAVIDQQEQEARVKFQQALNDFRECRASLQALTHVEAA